MLSRRGFLGGVAALLVAPYARVDRKAWKVRNHATNYGILNEAGLRRVMGDNYAVSIRIPYEAWEDDAYGALREMSVKLAKAVNEGRNHGW